jgi:hypothetical protein
MKRYINSLKLQLSLFCLLTGLLYACKEESVGQQPVDHVAPGSVWGLTWEAISGGAVFKYHLPEDDDLLYVKAVYERIAGEVCEVRASIYTDSLKIEGFGDAQPKLVRLIAVDRSRNESTPLEQSITPLEPVVYHIGESLDLREDFGGVHASWDNPERKEVAVVLMRKDNNKEYATIETFYSSMAIGDAAKRGMDTIPEDFSIFVQDRWLNRSETKYFTLTP